MDGLRDVIASSGLGTVVSKVAPVLGAVLGTPLAGMGLSLLGNLFGLDAKNINGLVEAVEKNPLEVKKLELAHLEALEAIASKNYEIEVDDRKSARAREINLKDHIPMLLSVGFLLNYAAIQFYCVTHPSNAIDIISARFQDVLIMIMSYYFGSSHSSREK